MQGDISVSVDRDFARFGKKSYAINKINSVEVREHHPHSQNAALLWFLLAVIFLMAAIGGGGASSVVFALICGGLAFWAWRRGQIVEYQLFLMTSSSEAQAISSRDVHKIERLRNHIEGAMAGHFAPAE